jgi:hypothetical protein
VQILGPEPLEMGANCFLLQHREVLQYFLRFGRSGRLELNSLEQISIIGDRFPAMSQQLV